MGYLTILIIILPTDGIVYLTILVIILPTDGSVVVLLVDVLEWSMPFFHSILDHNFHT